jgi:hypothetical protein
MLLITKTFSIEIWRKILTKSYSNGDRVLRHCLLPPHFPNTVNNCSLVLAARTYTVEFPDSQEYPKYQKEKLLSKMEIYQLERLCSHAFSVISWSKKGLALRHSTTWLAISLTDCFYRRDLHLKPYIGYLWINFTKTTVGMDFCDYSKGELRIILRNLGTRNNSFKDPFC